MSEQYDPEHIEMVQEFVQEIRELLDELEPVIIEMGQSCSDDGEVGDITDDINSIFRLFHSIKGAAGFLNFTNIATSSHSAENLLDLIRTDVFPLTADHIDLLCQGIDFIRAAIDHVENEFNDEALAEESKEIRDKFLQAIEHSKGGDTTAAAPETAPAPPKAEAPPLIDLYAQPAESVSPEMVKSFISEASYLLQNLEEELLRWLKDLIHSFKGNCGFLDFADMEALSHQMESVIDFTRTGGQINKTSAGELLLKLIDIHRESVTDIDNGGSGEIIGLDIYRDMLADLLPANQKLAPIQQGKQAPLPAPPERLGEILIEQGATSKEEISDSLAQQNKPLGEILLESGSVDEKQIEKAVETQAKRRQKKAPGKQAVKKQDIRVDLGKLDSLIDFIGELVIAENMVINNPDLEELELDNFQKAGQHLGKIVRDLQEMAMTLRMIPVSGLFRRMIRLVHDLSRKSGKKVDLQLIGEETEVDKTVIETITDPLVHLLRNSMDHGIEPAEKRLAANKPESGTIKLSAFHEEGVVKITIDDDGGGLPRDKILAKAVEKGLINGDGSDMSDKDVFALIFAPGFSTADQVTDISGRGVGMDVVRQNLEKIKGSIDISSKPGQGTKVELQIPLTLAIIEGMLVRSGESRYIIPIINIIESFRATPEMITIAPDGQEVVKVRENLLPIIRLHEMHGLTPDNHELEKGILVVLEARGANFCLLVDELLGQQQTVIKGLSSYVSKFGGNIGGVSGCTIMGDGEVCLILDVQKILEMTQEPEGE